MAAEFFNDITIAMKHSLAAAADNRGGVYAAHHSLGKASIWFTFCPDDTHSFKILIFFFLDMNQFQTLVQRLKNNIDTFAVGELALPATETETIVNCLDVNCPGRLQLNSKKMLMIMRRRPLVPATEASALRCDTCHSCHSISQAIDAAMERGFQRCFCRPKLSPEEIQNFVWRQLRPKPAPTDEHDLDCWLLHLASIQLSVNMHDWKHRESCFKNGRKECRHKTPYLPVDETSVEQVFVVNLDAVSQKPANTVRQMRRSFWHLPITSPVIESNSKQCIRIENTVTGCH
jgi:hypothetical protein